MSLGTTLRATRQAQGLSQKQTASGLCAQSMLSAIEHDRYVPNARLLLQLCHRLAISLDTVSLAKNFNISASTSLNHTMQLLCNQHHYQDLKTFLLSNQTLVNVTTAHQTQAYYYYLGVARLHVDANLDAAQQALSFATTMVEERQPTVLTRLARATLAIVVTKRGQEKRATALMDQALSHIDTLNYQENCNVIFYLAALQHSLRRDFNRATTATLAAITYITDHDSHYMLANCYRLLAEIASREGHTTDAETAQRKQLFLTALFHEVVPRHF